MISIGPKQINDLVSLVEQNNSNISDYRRVLQADQQQAGGLPPPPPLPSQQNLPQAGGPPPPPPPSLSSEEMPGREKRFKLVRILNYINSTDALKPIVQAVKTAAFTAFGEKGRDTIKPEEIPAMRDLYIEFIFDTLNKANFSDARTAQGKRDAISQKLKELLESLPGLLKNLGDDAADADLISLVNTIKTHSTSLNGKDTIEKKISEISEEIKEKAARELALQDPILGPKIKKYETLTQDFIRLHAQLRAELDSKDAPLSEDNLAKKEEYKRLQEIEKLATDEQSKVFEAAKKTDLYVKFLDEEEGKRKSNLEPLEKSKGVLDEQLKELNTRLAGIAPEDIAQRSNIKAYIVLAQERLEEAQARIKYLKYGQEEENIAKDEINLFSKLHSLWIADEKSEVSKKAQHAWKDAFQSAYQAITGNELTDEEFLRLKEQLKNYNDELKPIIGAADFRTQPWQDKHAAISAVNQKYHSIIGGDIFTNYLLQMGLRHFTETESVGDGDSKRNVPTLKSKQYLETKIGYLKKEQQNAELLSNALKVSDSKSSGKGYRKTGELEIQLISKKVDDREVAKLIKKDNLIGLLVKVVDRNAAPEDKDLNFVLSGNFDAKTINELNSLTTKHKFSTNDKQQAIKGMAKYMPLLEMLSKPQIKRLANFMGPDFALTFNVDNENDIESLKSALESKLGNSAVTMGDLMLVALGYRYRGPEFLLISDKLKEEGFVFNADVVAKGDEFFADKVVIIRDYNKSDDVPIPEIENVIFEEQEVYEKGRNRELVKPIRQQTATLKAVSTRAIEDGQSIASINDRDMQDEFVQFFEQLHSKIAESKRALSQLLEAAGQLSTDNDYKAYRDKLEELGTQLPNTHPQFSLIQFLYQNPDVYSAEGKQGLAEQFAISVVHRYQMEALDKQFDKLIHDIQNTTEAKIKAKAKLEEEANADEEKKLEIRNIRDELKIKLYGDVGANENDEQTRLLDEFAFREYEQKHGGARKTVVQKAEEQVGNLGTQIQQVEQKIQFNREIVRDEQELRPLRDELRQLNEDKERLERELAALRQLQQQRAEVAQLTPEAAYKRSHKVDDMLIQAALQHTPKLDWKDVNQWIRNAEKGNVKLGVILNEAKEKVATYNSNPEERRKRYGW